MVSYFKGDPTSWKTGLATWGTLVYPDLWPGIDLVYTGTSTHLKYTFVVHPGADPRQIELAYRGATSVRVTDEGRLEISTPLGGFGDDTPYAYQEVAGRQDEVSARYVLDYEPASDSYRYRFAVAPYDTSRTLILDPVFLAYAGYIGGSGRDQGEGITVDASGNAYVTGTTASGEATFPETVGPILTASGGDDAFVAKVNPSGTALIYGAAPWWRPRTGRARPPVPEPLPGPCGGTTRSSDRKSAHATSQSGHPG